MRSCNPLNRRRQILATLPLAAAVSTAITATSLLAPNTAMAQLEEVVVTARARTESLQDVPATVTAFTEGQIENMGIARAEDFVYMTNVIHLSGTSDTPHARSEHCFNCAESR